MGSSILPAYLTPITVTMHVAGCRGFSDFSMDPHNFRNEGFDFNDYPVVGVATIVGVDGSLINFEAIRL
jgi:hypothetical protein